MAGKERGLKKGTKIGEKTRFSSTYQPKKNGRKPSRFKQIISELEAVHKEPITKEDYNRIINQLLQLTPDELTKLAKDKNTPIAIIVIASAISGDIETKNIGNTEKLIDRIFGKEPIKQEITGAGLTVNFIDHSKDGH